MKRTKPISALAGTVALTATLLSPAQAGAQAAPVICDGLTATIVGTAGDDELIGTAGNDVFFAAQGNDVIFGLGGDDVICAGKGDDVVVGGPGFDVIFGAQGNDVLFAANGSSVADRADTRGARMFGGAGNDLIVGSNRWDRMQGGDGVDHFEGHEGRDWIRGGAGGDFLDGGPGIDDTNGGNGNDKMLVTAGDIVRGSNGNDLCNLTGKPGLLRSCTSDEQAFQTARTTPILPPTEAGIEQTIAYETTLTNRRDSEALADLDCSFSDAANVEEFYFDIISDRLGGEDWTLEILEVSDVSTGIVPGFGYFGSAFIVSEHSTATNSLVWGGDIEDNFVYERGIWRASCLAG